LLKGTASAVPQPPQQHWALAPEVTEFMFGKFFRDKSAQPPSHPGGKQAVLLHIDGEDFDRMVEISDKLTDAIEGAKIGVFDGNEIGGNETVLFMYGPDAELIFNTIEPILMADETLHGTKAIIRWGNHGAPQREVIIGSQSNHAQ
jgi:hypothetical protein